MTHKKREKYLKFESKSQLLTKHCMFRAKNLRQSRKCYAIAEQTFLLVFSNSFTSVIYGDTLTNHIDFDEVTETPN